MLGNVIDSVPVSVVPAPPRFHVMAKPTGAVCNLACSYCFFLDKAALYPESSFRMSDEVLEAYVRQLIEAHRSSRVTFAWQGGEPTLMGLDFFRRATELQDRYRRPGMTFENTIQTNGTRLDEEWGVFLAEHEFLVGISIDGPREVHDANRVNKGGAATFDDVMRGLRVLQAHGVEYNVLTTVNRVNGDFPLEVYRFLRDEIGTDWMQFIPVVERLDAGGRPDPMHGTAVSDRSVLPSQFGTFLSTVFDEWVRHDVGRTFVQLFDVSLGIWALGHSSLCAFQPTCGQALAIEHTGDLYACDHYVFPAWRRGNILDEPIETLVESEDQRRFGLDKRDALPRCCRECPVLFACRGECPKTRFATSPDGEPGLNYLCAGYRRFFAHVAPYMEFMKGELAERKPPANVMAWAAERDRRAGVREPGRNDPCPCGSGAKFKRCCGAGL